VNVSRELFTPIDGYYQTVDWLYWMICLTIDLDYVRPDVDIYAYREAAISDD